MADGIFGDLEAALKDDWKATQGIEFKLNEVWTNTASEGKWFESEYKNVSADDQEKLYKGVTGVFEEYLKDRGIDLDKVAESDHGQIFQAYFGMSKADIRDRIENMEKIDAQAFMQNITQIATSSFFNPKVGNYLADHVTDENLDDARTQLLNTYSTRGQDAPDAKYLETAKDVRQKIQGVYLNDIYRNKDANLNQSADPRYR